MDTKLPRIICVFITNTVASYLFSIVAFLVLSVLTGNDPTKPGLLMISPLAFLIFGMIVPALFLGLINGSLINVFWTRFTASNRYTIKFASLLGFTIALFPSLPLLIEAINHRESLFQELGKTLLWFLIIFLVCFYSNVITVLFTKNLFPPKPLP